MITRKHNKHNNLARISALALFVPGMGALQAATTVPDLSAPGSFYVDLAADGSNHDALANGWITQNRPDFGGLENDDWIRGNPGNNPGFFTMTVGGLTPGLPYDVAAVFVDQVGKDVLAGVDPGNMITLNKINGTATISSEALVHANWDQLQTDPGVLGTATALGDGTLQVYFDHPGGESFLDGVVLTPIPEPSTFLLLAVGLISGFVARRRHGR